MNGYFGYAAMIVKAWWFSPALLLSGLLWLAFVGESPRAVKSRILPYIGWAVSGLIALTILLVLVAGYGAGQAIEQEIDFATLSKTPAVLRKRFWCRDCDSPIFYGPEGACTGQADRKGSEAVGRFDDAGRPEWKCVSE
jgi:hypothetical protein